MTSLWTNLLLLHGYISDWRLALRLADTATPEGPAAPAAPAAAPRHERKRPGWPRLCLSIGDGSMRRQ